MCRSARREPEEWIATASENGIVAFDTETTSLDPMQAELGAFRSRFRTIQSSRTPRIFAPPICHSPIKPGADDLFSDGVKLVENQVPMAEALALLMELLEDPSVLKVART